MPKLCILPFADTGTDFDNSDGWVEIDVKDEFDALTWCCNHAGLVEIAEYGIDRARIVCNGKIDWYA